MLVSEYATNVINNRPLKYGTRQSYFKIIKSLGIWDMEIEALNCATIFDKVDQLRSHNVKKNIYICLRSVFRDLGIFKDLPILQGISKNKNEFGVGGKELKALWIHQYFPRLFQKLLRKQSAR